MPIALSPERDQEVERILARYPNRQAALIPILHVYQAEKGWLDDDAMETVAARLGLSAAHVKGVVTFYTLFNQHPVGEHQVWVCRTLSCALRGSEQLLDHCEKRLGVHPGETTRDGKVTLRTAECLASCGTAPMMQVDRNYYEGLTKAKVDEILNGLTSGGAEKR
jgi:NADH-quinone oxidoreductase subunit E